MNQFDLNKYVIYTNGPVRKAFLLIFMLVQAFGGAAQPVGGRVLRYSIKEGLSFGVVNSIVQDRDGMMWLATGDGLNRFDGTTFQTFRANAQDSTALLGNYVKAVFRDRDGVVWASSRYGLNEFVPDRQSFRRYKPFAQPTEGQNDVTDISQASDGGLWLALNGGGLGSFDKRTRRFRLYNRNNVAGLSTNSILEVFEDSKGLLWLGTRDGGIEVLRRSGQHQWLGTGLAKNLIKTRVHAIREDRNGNIWVASGNGLFYFKRSENRFYTLSLPTFHHSNIYLSLLEDGKGRILVGVQDGGIYSYDLKKHSGRIPASGDFEQVRSNDDRGVTQRSVQALYLDRDGNTWAGTYGEGVYVISSMPEKFRKFEQIVSDSRGESLMRYYGMCTDKAGNLWIGTDGDGIYKMTSEGKVIKHYAPDGRPGSLMDGAVIAAYRDKQDRLWFGTYSKGLFLYDPATDGFKRFAHNPADPQSLGRNDVRVIFQDSRKTMWVGTNGGGLGRLDEQTGRFKNYIPSNSSINANDVRAITEDQNGVLWIGTYGGGLNSLDVKTETFRAWFNEQEKLPFLSNRIIFSLYADARNRLLIGSEGNGLLVFDQKQKSAVLYNDRKGLANNVINAIQPEDADKVWISTNKGLSRINLANGRIENYDRSQGLQDGQFNPGSALYHAQGRFMCFGGTEGWNLFRPDQIKPSQYKPKVMITGHRIFGAEQGEPGQTNAQSAGETLVLDADQPVFSIQYTALNYAYPERSNFAYMLEGIDKEWNFVGQERTAVFRYLPAGDYVFKVRASNHDNVWFQDYASVHIHIRPPWYRTWWAYLAYLLSGALLIYLYQRYKLNQQKLQYEIQLAHLETRKEKEVNERKLSFFTNVSHEFRTPLTLIINPVRELLASQGYAENSSLNIIYRNAKRLLSLVDQLLLFRKADLHTDSVKAVNLDLGELAQEVFNYFVHQAEQKHIRYELVNDLITSEIVADREQLEIALFNLVSNAMKFTPGHGTVTVSLCEEGEEVFVKVADTGPGIPADAGDSIFQVFNQYKDHRFPAKTGFGIGLYLAKTFVDNHYGSLSYISEKDAGTVFTIRLWKKHEKLAAVQADVPDGDTRLLSELASDALPLDAVQHPGREVSEELGTENRLMLIVDDDAEIRAYLRKLFVTTYEVLEASSGEEGMELVRTHQPDIVITDIMMSGMTGIDLCNRIKSEPAMNHIPVVLLTASSSQETRLRGIEGGADDYICKPFDKELLVARVAAILRSRNDIRKYFYNEITLQTNDLKISPEYREFLRTCISVVETHLSDPDFSVKVLAAEIGMSHSTLYNRIKSISGQSMSSFIRFIRLRKAAQLLITTDITIGEAAFQVGVNDIKYFREQFQKLFGMKPSEYVKKYRKSFHERSSSHTATFASKSS